MLDAQVRVGGHPTSGSSPGLVEGLAQVRHDLGRVGVEGEVLTGLFPLLLPGVGREELGAGIAPPYAARCVHVPVA